MYTFVRHSTKEYPNNSRGKRHRLDAELTPSGRRLIEEKALDLVEYDAIVTSPYRRARQTAEILAHSLRIENTTVEPLLSEYLGNQTAVRDEDWHSSTLSLSPVGIESFEEFEERMTTLAHRIRTEYTPSTIIVTHGLVISMLTSVKVDEGCACVAAV